MFDNDSEFTEAVEELKKKLKREEHQDHFSLKKQVLATDASLRKRADVIDKLYQVADEFGPELIGEAASLFDEYYSQIDLEASDSNDLCLTGFVGMAIAMRRKNESFQQVKILEEHLNIYYDQNRVKARE